MYTIVITSIRLSQLLISCHNRARSCYKLISTVKGYTLHSVASNSKKYFYYVVATTTRLSQPLLCYNHYTVLTTIIQLSQPRLGFHNHDSVTTTTIQLFSLHFIQFIFQSFSKLNSKCRHVFIVIFSDILFICSLKALCLLKVFKNCGLSLLLK